jgi:hypothetical protein
MSDILVLEEMLKNELKPLVRKIDAEAFYPGEFLKSLGKKGFFRSEDLSYPEVISREVLVVKEIAKVCMTTAFNLWCHLAALTYVRNSENQYLKREILPSLENGELLGGTGLSNPMKYYAGLEPLHLKAKKANGGYMVTGNLPSVSNLGPDHWFGIVAEVDDNQRIMAIVPSSIDGLSLKEKLEYMGVNGSATYACSFNDVFIPDQYIVSEQADEFIPTIRPAFVLYQIPLGLGVTAASITSIHKVCKKQGGCNQFLNLQPEELMEELEKLNEKTFTLASASELTSKWQDLLQLRLSVVNLTLQAAHASMLHNGGAGYLQNSDPSRRLRETYFLANLTPTVKHLEKLMC